MLLINVFWNIGYNIVELLSLCFKYNVERDVEILLTDIKISLFKLFSTKKSKFIYCILFKLCLVYEIKLSGVK